MVVTMRRCSWCRRRRHAAGVYDDCPADSLRRKQRAAAQARERGGCGDLVEELVDGFLSALGRIFD